MRTDGLNRLVPVVQPQAAAGTEADPKLRRAALAFEELLVRQLTQVLADTATSDDDGGDSSTSFYADQLPAALASAITDAGGLGLAAELERALRTQS